MSDDKKGSAVIGVAGSALKADTAMVTTASDNFPADSFEGLYYSQGEGNAPTVAIIEPQYKPHILHALSTQNNTLRQCIEAMEVNIDGTGHSIEAVDTDVEDEKEKDILESFFNEPYPNKTMVELRRAIRVDVEETGMGYMEVCRDGLDEIVMLNHIPSANMRLLRYDEPVMVSKSLKRGDSVIEVKVRTRERRFVQRINGTNTFFKEFGASRDLDRKTGAWVEPQKGKLRLDISKRASEIVVFGGVPEAKTPYCSPRWINQLPSVLGSRKAEEFNLEYFDAGGVPPAIILVQGGYLGETVKQDLERKLSSKAQNSRVVVLEAISASGSLDSSGTVSVRVERFGCVDDTTEILTDTGWLPISMWAGQPVATNKKGSMVFETPIAYHSYDYEGDLLHFEGAATEFMVTPNHRVLRDSPSGMEFEEASRSFKRSNLKVPVASPKGMLADYVPYFAIAGKTYAADTFLDFLGMFIADGSTTKHESNKNAIKIAVLKDRKKEFLTTFMPTIAKEAGGRHKVYALAGGYDAHHLYAPSLREWLHEEVGAYANEKRIPAEMLRLGSAQSLRLLKALLEGDGHYNGEGGRNGWAYTTVSSGLADDVQQLCLNAGYRSVLSKVHARDEWCVSITPKHTAHLTKGKSPNWGTTSYAGKVYCFTMSTGVFFTRRNGKIVLTGNSERQNDSMFQNYDKNCEEHVRVGFRLPPMFIGRAQDYNFATAVTAYMVAEAQVFLPEREEFDSKINNTIVKALGVTKYKFRSLPLTLVDSDKQLKALAMVQGTAISGEELVKRLNEITGLNMQYEKQEPPAPPAQANSFGGGVNAPQQDLATQTVSAQGNTTDPSKDQAAQDLNATEVDLLKQKTRTTKSETLGYILGLATRWIGAVGLDGAPDSSVDLVALKREINSLGEEDSEAFHGAITALTMKKASSSLDGLKELCGCAAHME